MHISPTITLPFVLLLTTSTAAPTESRLQRRGLSGAVYICTDTNFRGDCAWQTPSMDCRVVGTGANAPESIGPDPDGYCGLYSDGSCTNIMRSIRFPGVGDGLSNFHSIKCFKDGRFQYRPYGQQGTDPFSGDRDAPRKYQQPKLKGYETEVPGFDGSGIEVSEQNANEEFHPSDLAGGVGSTEWEEVKEQMTEMEKDGFSEGFIGQKKGLYY